MDHLYDFYMHSDTTTAQCMKTGSLENDGTAASSKAGGMLGVFVCVGSQYE